MLAPPYGSASSPSLTPMNVTLGAIANTLADSPVPWLPGSVQRLVADGASTTDEVKLLRTKKG